eukprot:scaffold4092_cov76-Skeletonema_marinoi.AAC.1
MEKKKERASSGDPKSKQIPERPSKVTVGNKVCPTHPLVANISSTAASSADAETAASSGTPLDTSK